MAFDIRMNAFYYNQRDKLNSRCNRLIEAAKATNSSILRTDQGFLWHYVETPAYKRIKKSQEYLEVVAIELVTQKLSFYQETNVGQSLLDGYLRNPNLNLQDIIGMACDLLLAGVDTSSYATAFALYHLSTNLEVQEKVFEECKRILPEKDSPMEVANLSKSNVRPHLIV